MTPVETGDSMGSPVQNGVASFYGELMSTFANREIRQASNIYLQLSAEQFRNIGIRIPSENAIVISFSASDSQDFKPANCMLCSDGLIKITDFGAWFSGSLTDNVGSVAHVVFGS